MAEDICLENHGNTTKQNTWLEEFARNVTSQYGEDGIIEKILEVIGENDRWCVEFGSWDGKRCSNTFSLINEGGYSAVLIEGDSKRFKDLIKTFEGNEKTTLMNTFVGFEKEDGLDALLKTIKMPVNFDLLSIDIDGNDYHVWQAIWDYKPKVVVIEFNPTISKAVEFIKRGIK